MVILATNLVPQTVWSRPYDTINAFEKGLIEHDTHILKFYLRIAKEEQRKRFEEGLEGATTQKRLFVLQVIQPGLADLMDSSVSTLAPLFAAAFATRNAREAFLEGRPGR